MPIHARILADVKTAMKQKEKDKLTVLRCINSAIKMHALDKKRASPLEDQHVVEIMLKMVKQRQDAKHQYEQANRPDLAAVESMQISIIQSYLPVQLSKKEISAMIDAIIQENKLETVQDIGRIMQILRNEPTGSIDMRAASEIAKSRLQ